MSAYGEVGLADLFTPTPHSHKHPQGLRLVRLESADCKWRYPLDTKATPEKPTETHATVEQEQILPIVRPVHCTFESLVLPEFLSLKSKTE